MKSTLQEIDYEVKKKLTNAICVSGGNLYSMELLLKKKYVSKKELLKILETQRQYLAAIENSKNEIDKLVQISFQLFGIDKNTTAE